MARDAAFTAFEHGYGSPIGEPLRAAIAAHGGDEIGQVRLYAADEIVERNQTYETQLYCPGYVTIGDDGGGRAVVVHGALEPPAVFVVGHGSMSADDFVEVGAGLHDWIADGCPVGR